MKGKLFALLVICLLVYGFAVVAESSPSKAFRSNSNAQVFRLTSNDVQTAYVKWGEFCWTLKSEEIDSFIIMLRKVRKEDIKPYHGPFPKGGPFQVSLTMKSNEHFTFTVGVGGQGYVLFSPREKVYLPGFNEFKNPFIERRANEAKNNKPAP
ncbi:hypothetical protein FHS19_003524 [Paenibacillus rhizosphaerae]|uniref:Uncharacterized protein n=1 Tax=Paenibacillus rhizosphaerae TaxID=297318 RepID=A0A839TU91_9BACL|nr:hypothetical protein [Paenibacillus rhizosphaerae]MBB3128849.1 hypothetical protein [Paenibacillus rhizosphaerae]